MVAAKCNAVEAVRYLLGEGASPDGSAKVKQRLKMEDVKKLIQVHSRSVDPHKNRLNYSFNVKIFRPCRAHHSAILLIYISAIGFRIKS